MDMKRGSQRGAIRMRVTRAMCVTLAWVVWAPMPAQALDVAYDVLGDKARIHAVDTTVVELLSRIAEVTGIHIEIDSQVGQEKISVDSEFASLEEALRQSLRRYSYVLFYGQYPGRNRVVSLILMPRGAPSGTNLVLAPPVPGFTQEAASDFMASGAEGPDASGFARASPNQPDGVVVAEQAMTSQPPARSLSDDASRPMAKFP